MATPPQSRTIAYGNTTTKQDDRYGTPKTIAYGRDDRLTQGRSLAGDPTGAPIRDTCNTGNTPKTIA